MDQSVHSAFLLHIPKKRKLDPSIVKWSPNNLKNVETAFPQFFQRTPGQKLKDISSPRKSSIW